MSSPYTKLPVALFASIGEIRPEFVVRLRRLGSRLAQVLAVCRALHERLEALAHEGRLRRRVRQRPLPQELGVDQGRVQVLAPSGQGPRNLAHPLDRGRRGRRLVTGPVHEELEDTVLQVGRGVAAPVREAGGRHLLAQMRLQQGEIDPLVVGQGLIGGSCAGPWPGRPGRREVFQPALSPPPLVRRSRRH